MERTERTEPRRERGKRGSRGRGPAEHDYLADDGLATSIFLALRLQRPLLLEGEAGVGKTEVAKVLARWTGGELVRLQCYEGIDAAQAVYEWDYSRQLLHLRARSRRAASEVDEDELYSERFLVKRPLLRAIAHDGDRARRSCSSTRSTAPTTSSRRSCSRSSPTARSRCPSSASSAPRCRRSSVLTSNRTRDVHDALKRRCLYHWIAHPDFERELAILRVPRARGPGAAGARGRRPRSRRCAASSSTSRRASPRRSTGPQALATLGATGSTSTPVDVTLGTILKYREDQERVRAHGLAELVHAAVARSA